MHAIEIILELHKHRTWTNNKLLAVASTLDASQLKQPFAIGQGSVWASLVHMFGAEFVWNEAFNGNEKGVAPGDVEGKLPGNQLGQDPIPSLEVLEQHWRQLNIAWEGALGKLTDESLNDVVYRINSMTGVRAATRRSDVLLHLNLHAHYTAAQTINMFRQLGLRNLPDPMFITMARERISL